MKAVPAAGKHAATPKEAIGLKVRQVASSAVVIVGPMQTMWEAANLMANHRVGSAVVHDADHLVGILTERDVLKAVAAGAAPNDVYVRDIMTPDVVTVGPDWDLIEAANAMAQRRIRHLVVYEGGQLLGVLSVRDILPAILPRQQASAADESHQATAPSLDV